MDHDDIWYINNVKQSADWLAKLKKCRAELPAWVSSFHPKKLPYKLLYEIDEHDSNSSYSWVVHLVFTCGEVLPT